jgi:hypothetical protein
LLKSATPLFFGTIAVFTAYLQKTFQKLLELILPGQELPIRLRVLVHKRRPLLVRQQMAQLLYLDVTPRRALILVADSCAHHRQTRPRVREHRSVNRAKIVEVQIRDARLGEKVLSGRFDAFDRPPVQTTEHQIGLHLRDPLPVTHLCTMLQPFPQGFTRARHHGLETRHVVFVAMEPDSSKFPVIEFQALFPKAQNLLTVRSVLNPEQYVADHGSAAFDLACGLQKKVRLLRSQETITRGLRKS